MSIFVNSFIWIYGKMQHLSNHQNMASDKWLKRYKPKYWNFVQISSKYTQIIIAFAWCHHISSKYVNLWWYVRVESKVMVQSEADIDAIWRCSECQSSSLLENEVAPFPVVATTIRSPTDQFIHSSTFNWEQRSQSPFSNLHEVFGLP